MPKLNSEIKAVPILFTFNHQHLSYEKLIYTFSLLSMLFVASAQTNYELDKNHAGLGLSTTHFGVSHVEGSLKSKSADFSDAVIEMTAMISSINTDSDV